MVSTLRLVVALAASMLSLAHPMPHHEPRDIKVVGINQSSVLKRQEPAAPGTEFEVLSSGNKVFRESDPALLKKLTDEGQSPPFMFLGCSDSRVSEGTVFNAKPGTFFSQRNIANQFHANDPNSESVLAYGVSVLGVKHVIVMGHYGCGGVAAAIASPPASSIDAASSSVQSWIEPIRAIFASSSRPEIVELRERIKGNTTVEEPDIKEPGFRALVEENVKAGVSRIASHSVIVNHYAALAQGNAAITVHGTSTTTSTHAKRADHHSGPPEDVFIHGWVYDIENGEVRDLGVSIGPPGKAIPPAPFSALSTAIQQTTTSHQTVTARCGELCKSKRSYLPQHH